MKHLTASRLYEIVKETPHPMEMVKVGDGKTNGGLQESLPLNDEEISTKKAVLATLPKDLAEFLDPEDMFMFIRGYAKEEDAVAETKNQLVKTLKWRQSIFYDKFLMTPLPLSDRFHSLYPEWIHGTDKYDFFFLLNWYTTLLFTNFLTTTQSGTDIL